MAHTFLLFLKRELIGLCDFFRAYKQQSVLSMALTCHQYVENVLGENPNGYTTRLVGTHKDEDEPEAHGCLNLKREFVQIWSDHCCRMLLLYLFGEYDEADKARLQMNSIPEEAGTVITKTYRTVVYALNCLAMAREHPEKRNKYIRKAQSYATNTLKPLTKGDGDAPDLRILLNLIRAEEMALRHHSVNKSLSSVLVLYEQVIMGLNTASHFVFEGLACERAALALIDADDPDRAADYLQRAWMAFTDYGATAKLDQMRRDYVGITKFEECQPTEQTMQTKVPPMLLQGELLVRQKF